MYFIGLDIGTSAVKAALFAESQTIVATASLPLKSRHPNPSWSEQDPEDWWRATQAAFKELKQQAPEAWNDVRSIGLSGQMHGAVLLDRQGAVIRPAILWNDNRAVAESHELNDACPDLGRIAGVPAMPGFTAPKLLWLSRHEPSSMERTAILLLPKDYIRFRLTGSHATDMSDASGTLWLDIARREWSAPIVEASHLRLDQLPRLCEGPEATGQVNRDIARQLDLPDDVVVAAGAGDAIAAAIGLGVINDGDGLVSIGTSAQYFVAGVEHRPAPESFVHAYAHALPHRWCQMAALLNGGSCLAWAANLVRGGEAAQLLAEAEADYRGPSDVLFLPYLTGERTPHNDPAAKGVFYGLTPAARTGDLILSVIEGVAFALADGQQSLAGAGTRARTLAVTGGGARSRFWMRILATILDRSLTLFPASEFAPALGAARLARMVVTGERAETICVPPAESEVIAPNQSLVAAYRKRHGDFRALYQALRKNFRQG